MPDAARSASSAFTRASSEGQRKSAPPVARSSGGLVGTPALSIAEDSTAVPAKNSQNRQSSKDAFTPPRSVVTSLVGGEMLLARTSADDGCHASVSFNHQGRGAEERKTSESDKSSWSNSTAARVVGATAGGALRSEEEPQPSSARAPLHFLGWDLPSPLVPLRLLFLPLAFPPSLPGHTVKAGGGTDGAPLVPAVGLYFCFFCAGPATTGTTLEEKEVEPP